MIIVVIMMMMIVEYSSQNVEIGMGGSYHSGDSGMLFRPFFLDRMMRALFENGKNLKHICCRRWCLVQFYFLPHDSYIFLLILKLFLLLLFCLFVCNFFLFWREFPKQIDKKETERVDRCCGWMEKKIARKNKKLNDNGENSFPLKMKLYSLQ